MGFSQFHSTPCLNTTTNHQLPCLSTWHLISFGRPLWKPGPFALSSTTMSYQNFQSTISKSGTWLQCLSLYNHQLPCLFCCLGPFAGYFSNLGPAVCSYHSTIVNYHAPLRCFRPYNGPFSNRTLVPAFHEHAPSRCPAAFQWTNLGPDTFMQIIQQSAQLQTENQRSQNGFPHTFYLNQQTIKSKS